MTMQSSHTTSDVRATMQPRRGMAVGKIEKARDPRRALSGLLKYLDPFKMGLIFVLICVVIYSLLGLAGPYLMGVAIDKFIAVRQVDGLAQIALWMLATYLLNNLFQAIAAWVMSNISQDALKLLRRDLFQHLQTMPQSFFDQNSAGELMSRLTNDIDAINQAGERAFDGGDSRRHVHP